jgi:hypothetical protein
MMQNACQRGPATDNVPPEKAECKLSPTGDSHTNPIVSGADPRLLMHSFNRE